MPTAKPTVKDPLHPTSEEAKAISDAFVQANFGTPVVRLNAAKSMDEQPDAVVVLTNAEDLNRVPPHRIRGVNISYEIAQPR